MDYYNNSSNYYQNEMMNSPQQQQSYYPYSPNYQNAQRQGKYSDRSRRNSSRTQSMVMDQSSYYNQNEEGPQSPYTRSRYYDQPLIKYRRPSSSYYKNEEESVSSPYYMSSPPDYYQYQQHHYASPQKNSSRRTRSSENKQKYNDYPITPEEGRSFIYTSEEEMNHAGDNETYQEEEINNAGATTLTSAYTQYNDQDDIYQGDEDEDEEEEEEDQDPTTQRNTMLNAESNVMMNSTHTSPHESLTNNSTLYDSQSLSKEDAQPQEQQQQGKKTWFKNVVNSALVFKRKVKMLRKKDSMTIEQGSLLHQQQQQQPAIQFITATNNELLGDVLDAQQEKEILSQLSTPTVTPSSSFNMSPEKTKITNLDRIWVFRLIDPNQPLPDTNNIAWIGFDYDNQLAIENHLKQVSNLPENERFAVFYDSHIRYGKMPVIVTPSESKGYYFANEEQTDLIMLQVTFIENNHEKVTFVYRV